MEMRQLFHDTLKCCLSETLEHSPRLHCAAGTAVRVGHKLGQIGHKWDVSGTNGTFSVNFGSKLIFKEISDLSHLMSI